MRNEAHVEMYETIDALIKGKTPAALGITTEYNVFKGHYDQEVALLDLVLKSEYTKEIKDQDHRRDSVYRGVADAVKSGLNHFDADKQKAAEVVDAIFQHYGNIASRSFDEETAAIDDLLRELGYDPNEIITDNNPSSLNPAITALGLLKWLDELYFANQQFKSLMEARYGELAKRPSAQMRATRLDVDRAFRDIVVRLEALILIQGESAYADFVDELNAIITRYKNILAQQAGMRKAKKTDM
jgi:hypothetical protein